MAKLPESVTFPAMGPSPLTAPGPAADIDRNQLIEEDKRYRREVAKKNAAKVQLVTA